MCTVPKIAIGLYINGLLWTGLSDPKQAATHIPNPTGHLAATCHIPASFIYKLFKLQKLKAVKYVFCFTVQGVLGILCNKNGTFAIRHVMKHSRSVVSDRTG
jgi:hypothetical protein